MLPALQGATTGGPPPYAVPGLAPDGTAYGPGTAGLAGRPSAIRPRPPANRGETHAARADRR
ncbi:hypothetical protein ACWEN3_32595, partial [Streptomyces sp. NPDC004561]